MANGRKKWKLWGKVINFYVNKINNQREGEILTY